MELYKVHRTRAVFLIVVVIIAMVSPFITSHAESLVFEIIIDKGVVGDYTLGGVVLTLPGARSVEPKLVLDKGSTIRVKYLLGPGVVQEYLKASKARSISSYPAVTILLVDYEGNRSESIVLTSEFLVSLSIGKMDPDRITRILDRDPLAGLRLGKVEINKEVYAKLEKYGFVFTSNGVPGSNIPLMKWEEKALATKSCQWDAVVDPRLGIYYAKNWNHPAAGEELPSWFRERFVRVGSGPGASFYWEKFRDELVAAIYYVPVSVNLNDAIRSIAEWALWPSDPYWKGSTTLLPLESFVGANHWVNSLPPTVYSGWITIFSYKIENNVGTQDSVASLALAGAVMGLNQFSSISGLLVGGMFVSSESTSQNSVQGFIVDTPFKNTVKFYAVKGAVHSPGDYIITTWKVIGTVTCNGKAYRVIVPRTITTPLYSISLNFGTLREFTYNPSNLRILTQPGISILLKDYKYNPETYHGDGTPIYDVKIKHVTSQVNYGYNAIIGNPVFNFILSIFDYATSNPYESSAVNIAKLILDTGYINVNYNGGAVVILIRLSEDDQPKGYYLITIMNEVPKSLSNVQGVGSMCWGQVIFSLDEEDSPPPCAPGACPTRSP